ncbi:MAG: hypothetical protein E6J90_00600 [Deltaproteobacteria bacterium]|nr:MAG: hypothetical protein E6J91_19055 [Deltaproteobacteria bacterium]TMQ28384.1 MAG: hypothetical protein E6J90_00600 [Deltaproteobacteria bacterium]
MLRRDVTFEMCGTTATLSLTGTQLRGATTAEVLRPIRGRLYAWVSLSVVIGLLGVLLHNAAVGSSKYFATARAVSSFLVVAALVCAIPALGALLRSWRGGTRFHPIQRSTKLWSLGSIAALASIGVVGLAARPSSSEVQRALAASDVSHARDVVTAIEERGGTPETSDLRDEVMFAEAHKLGSEQQLRVLEDLASGKGTMAARAAAEARTLRLEEVEQLLARQQPVEALAILDKHFAGDTAVAEQRARAHDIAQAACPTVACRFDEARQARDAQTTPERVAATDTTRKLVLATLDPAQVDAKQPLPRIQQLQKLHEAGNSAMKLASDDAELQERAHRAIEVAGTGLSKIPVIGNDLAVAEGLLGPSISGATGPPAIALDGVTVFLSLDDKGRCTGVYAVGDKANQREIKSETWPPVRLLSQALGHEIKLSAPGKSELTRPPAGDTPVVIRWLDGNPIELRIGNATP